MACSKPRKRKNMLKYPTGHICKVCYKTSTNEKAFFKAEREVRKSRRIRKAISPWEEQVLNKLYESNHISYSEMVLRKKELKDTVKKNNAVNWIKQEASKPTFQEEFNNLINGKKDLS